ncbi:bifunctional hydroxymethylpyrimidine kinase/phosphomethylpyrimidine kinase [Limnochorda pilosa]|uniref:Hydroxymethylpyrimidine/phosphomethylpyrimidine kinase n=1 Tax=Limnochorda pilosa TaxID=1555112 RepID=A0A0K2SJP9_LIMPI|nr:bifunctional hydroxymethylpyrimidine kinase/phosphomethylpyrimidine kinase [Limnochorda pilosa]BAS27232.1 phosphomethylpyrimidine kinase [Limnochorda pilosa]
MAKDVSVPAFVGPFGDRPPIALTIAGSDSGGGAGIQADLKTFTVLGCFGTSVLTAITAQNTLGVQAAEALEPSLVLQQMRSVMSDIGADAAKTGMLANAAVVEAVAQGVRELGIRPLVIDPVMMAKGGEPLLAPEARTALVEELLPLATVITPNIPEAEALTGLRIGSLDEMREAVRRLHGLGPAWVVVKGGHRTGPEAVDVVFDGTRFHELRAPRIDSDRTHGTGCTFSSAITAYLAHGLPVLDALRRAKTFVTRAIETAPRIGGGHGPTNHLWPMGTTRLPGSAVEAKRGPAGA